MASTQKLLEVNFYDDTETGDHAIGEIDFGINGAIDKYIEQYGSDEIIKTLAYLIYWVEKKHREILEKRHQDESCGKSNI